MIIQNYFEIHQKTKSILVKTGFAGLKFWFFLNIPLLVSEIYPEFFTVDTQSTN